MAATFELEIATPERLLAREQVTEAQIPAANGYLGILPGHAPLLSELGAGAMTYVADGRERVLAVDGGWVEVNEDHVRVLATIAEHADEIDADRADKSLKRAMTRLTSPDVTVDTVRAMNAAKRARARIAARQRMTGAPR